MIFIYLTSGLFLGWSLGANDAANVFGTAVGTRMLRFKTAALIASVFVILGAVFGGAGAAHTLGKLGAVNAIAGSFMVAFGAAFTVFLMTKAKLPVSTSQAVVGAIIGWNLFTGTLTDSSTLTKIISTWILCPVLSAGIAVILFYITKFFLENAKIHLLREDNYVRWGLIIVGAFGSYSLGANNIANVMGVFVPAVPFEPISIYGLITLSGAQQLFLIGGIAIAIGIYTYSDKVMDTVGNGLFKLSPITALVVVLSQAIVLFIFSSVQLESWLINHGVPSLPLVPVSSSQAVIGAVIGMGLAKGGRGIQYKTLGSISSGWVTTPIIAGLITLVGLFFLQNVFTQTVSKPVIYSIDSPVVQYLETKHIPITDMAGLGNRKFTSSKSFANYLKLTDNFSKDELAIIIESAKRHNIYINAETLGDLLHDSWLSDEQIAAVNSLKGKRYFHNWEFLNALVLESESWQGLPKTKKNKLANNELHKKFTFVLNKFTEK